MTEWRRLQLAYRLAVVAHYLKTYRTVGEAARALGMDPADFRRTRRRLEESRRQDAARTV